MKMRALAVSLWATLAVLVSHALGYFLAFSDPHARQHALEASGHSWYGLLFPALVVGAIAAFGSIFMESRATSKSLTASRVYGFSVLGFLAVEFFERLAHLGSLAEVWHNVSTPMGVLPVIISLSLLLVVVLPILLVARKIVKFLSKKNQTTPRPVLVIFSRTSAVFSSFWNKGFSALRGPPVVFQRTTEFS
jgi:hypothetical protein